MANFLQAADRIKQFAQDYKYMQEAADALASIGSLDQLLAERQAACDAATDLLNQTNLAIGQAAKDLEEAKEEASVLMADATIKSANMITSAEHEAALIAKQANDDAKAVKDAAQATVDAANEKARAAIAQANVMLAEISGEVATASDDAGI